LAYNTNVNATSRRWGGWGALEQNVNNLQLLPFLACGTKSYTYFESQFGLQDPQTNHKVLPTFRYFNNYKVKDQESWLNNKEQQQTIQSINSMELETFRMATTLENVCNPSVDKSAFKIL
jgi:hypothetical protein